MNEQDLTQIFVIAISVVLAFIFALILLANSLTQYQQYQDFITPLVMIVIAITVLAIFSMVSKVYYSVGMDSGKKRKK